MADRVYFYNDNIKIQKLACSGKTSVVNVNEWLTEPQQLDTEKK